MGCGCNGAKNKVATKFAYVAPNGAVKTFNSEIEAKAYKVRNENKGTVRPA